MLYGRVSATEPLIPAVTINPSSPYVHVMGCLPYTPGSVSNETKNVLCCTIADVLYSRAFAVAME